LRANAEARHAVPARPIRLRVVILSGAKDLSWFRDDVGERTSLIIPLLDRHQAPSVNLQSAYRAPSFQSQ
jgi:hypothetical protein